MSETCKIEVEEKRLALNEGGNNQMEELNMKEKEADEEEENSSAKHVSESAAGLNPGSDEKEIDNSCDEWKAATRAVGDKLDHNDAEIESEGTVGAYDAPKNLPQKDVVGEEVKAKPENITSIRKNDEEEEIVGNDAAAEAMKTRDAENATTAEQNDVTADEEEEIVGEGAAAEEMEARAIGSTTTTQECDDTSATADKENCVLVDEKQKNSKEELVEVEKTEEVSFSDKEQKESNASCSSRKMDDKACGTPISEPHDSEKGTTGDDGSDKIQILDENQGNQLGIAAMHPVEDDDTIEEKKTDLEPHSHIPVVTELRKASERTIANPVCAKEQSQHQVTEISCQSTEESLSVKPSLSFADAFADEQGPLPTLSPTFASAFADDHLASKSSSPQFAGAFLDNSACDVPIESRQQASILNTAVSSMLGSEDSKQNEKSNHSRTAVEAQNRKKSNDRLTTYVESAKKKSLPGDCVESRGHNKSKSSNPSKKSDTSRSTDKAASKPEKSPLSESVDTEALPELTSIRDRFENNSRKSESNFFEFGEAFREKQKHQHMTVKEKEKEAIVAMHGFDEKIVTQGKTATGEVDTSHLEKSFSPQNSADETIVLNCATCKVDYKQRDYRVMVFLIHRQRGLILFQNQAENEAECKVPGGKIVEEEFIKAAKQRENSIDQIELAARYGSLREVFNTTGINVQENTDKLVPAVLRPSPHDVMNGREIARNNLCDCHFYFLTINDDDFVKEMPGSDYQLSAPKNEPDSPLKLKLSSDVVGFEFVDKPLTAVKILNEKGDDNAAEALSMMVSHQGSRETNVDNFYSLSQKQLVDLEKPAAISREEKPKQHEEPTQPKESVLAVELKPEAQLHTAEACCCTIS